MHRRDVSELDVLRAIHLRNNRIGDDLLPGSYSVFTGPLRYFVVRPTPDESLADKYPVKLIMAKMEQLDRRGLLEVGVSLRTAWLTDKGMARLIELENV